MQNNSMDLATTSQIHVLSGSAPRALRNNSQAGNSEGSSSSETDKYFCRKFENSEEDMGNIDAGEYPLVYVWGTRRDRLQVDRVSVVHARNTDLGLKALLRKQDLGLKLQYG